MQSTNARGAVADAAQLPHGAALLRDPTLNKGTAFSVREREVLGLRGLLPPNVCTQEHQVARVLENFRRLQTPLAKYILLEALQDRNEALFYRVVSDNPDEMMPIIYTPTVGLACQQFGHIYRRPRGMYISSADRGQIEQVMRNWPYPEARSSSSPTASASSAWAIWAPTAWASRSASWRCTRRAPASIRSAACR
jgi:hypothetical protein